MSQERRIIRVADVMNPKVHTIDGLATVRQAMRKMRDEHVTSLIIEKRDDNDVWGLIALLDIARGVVAPGRSPDETHVYEIMTKPVVTVPPEMDVRFAARLLVNLRLRRAPVESMEGKLSGMVSLSDIVLKLGDLL